MKKIALFIMIGLIGFQMDLNAQGCASPSSDEGVTLWGYLQPEVAARFEDETQAAFQFRRMRIGVMGNIPYDFGYYVLLETSQFLNPNQTGPFLLDAFVSYNRFQYLKVALGSFKYPFGRELSMGCHNLYTIQRSRTVDELTANLEGGNRDLGLMLLGGSDTTFLTYRVALTNGTGTFQTENNLLDTYKITGRVTIQPVKGLYLGTSFRYGENPAVDETVVEPDTKLRYGFDAEYRMRNLTLIGEYIHGKDEGSYTEGGGCGGDAVTMTGLQNADGFYIMGIYRTSMNLEPVYKFERYTKNVSNGTDLNPNEEAVSMCQTFGVNYYPNDWTRIQVNYNYSAEQPLEVKNDQILVQLQVRF